MWGIYGTSTESNNEDENFVKIPNTQLSNNKQVKQGK